MVFRCYQLQQTLDPGHIQFTLLRWAIHEDDDEWLARGGISRLRQCVNCSSQGHTYPCGGSENVVCEGWITKKDYYAFNIQHISPDTSSTRLGTQHVAIVTKIVHQYQLMLREAGAMKHQETAPVVDTENWITNLMQRIYRDLPSDLKMTVLRSPHSVNNCCLSDEAITCRDRPPLHMSSVLAPPQACLVTCEFEEQTCSRS